MAKLPMGPPSLPSEPPNSDDTMNIVGLQTSTKLFSVDPPQFPKVPIDTPPTVSLNIPLSNLSDSSAPVAQSGQIMDAVDECEGGVREEPGTTSGHDEKTNPASMENKAKAFAAPYTIPLWSEHPGHPFYVEVLKDGTIIEQLDVSKKGAYMFGRVDLCDFILEHPTISRYHAVLQFKKNGETFLYDLGSTHGTSINKSQVKKKVYTDLHVGDVIRFGQSSRLYIFQGPSELMPPEGDLGNLRKYKIHEEVKDREASLSRARAEASLADGISWGMAEDAPEEDAEDDAYEITWQTYQGQLTERQEKTRSKIIKRMEKVANMKKENDAIRAKDISQGGLTQGQQTQIARNEQRTSQIMEELESLEETLNESIQESIGARVKKVSSSKKKGIIDDEDEIASDDDDFYDRTKKVGSLKNSSDQQSVETADTLLEKKDAILREMEEKAILLQRENAKSVSKTTDNIDQEDALDAYMTGLSSKLVFDATTKIQSEISTLQSELDRILYLLKIADPTGEAAQKKDAKPLISKSDEPSTLISNNIPKKSPSSSRKEKGNSKKPVATLPSQIVQAENPTEKGGNVTERENKAPAYFPTKPLLLGAVKDDESVDSIVDKPIVEEQEPDHFIDYKDRKKALCPTNGNDKIEDAAPGLILRKRKHTDEPRAHGSSGQESTLTSYESETAAAEAVALLLKHKRGYFGDDDEGDNIEQSQDGSPTGKKSQPKRVLGPEIPAFLKNTKDFESWVPPKGQSGDGRTALNDKFGY